MGGYKVKGEGSEVLMYGWMNEISGCWGMAWVLVDVREREKERMFV